jgi:hypothetical protein
MPQPGLGLSLDISKAVVDPPFIAWLKDKTRPKYPCAQPILF